MPPSTFRLLILTPDRQLLHKDNLTWVTARLIDGEIGIKSRHAPLLAETIDGKVDFGDEDESQSIDIQAGILKIDQDGVIIFTTGLFDPQLTRHETENEPIKLGRLADTLVSQLHKPAEEQKPW